MENSIEIGFNKIEFFNRFLVASSWLYIYILDPQKYSVIESYSKYIYGWKKQFILY